MKMLHCFLHPGVHAMTVFGEKSCGPTTKLKSITFFFSRFAPDQRFAVHIGSWVFQERLEAHHPHRMTKSSSLRLHILSVWFKCLRVRFQAHVSSETGSEFHLSHKILN